MLQFVGVVDWKEQRQYKNYDMRGICKEFHVLDPEWVKEAQPEEIDDIMGEWVAVSTWNQELYKERQAQYNKAYADLRLVLDGLGVVGKCKDGRWKGPALKLRDKLHKKIIGWGTLSEIVGTDVYIKIGNIQHRLDWGTPKHLRNLVEDARNKLGAEAMKDQAKAHIYLEAAEYGASKGFARNESETPDEFVARMHEAAEEIERAKLEGTKLDHSCCDNCSTWTVGERRCSCGNRRISMSFEGPLKAKYPVIEAY